MRKRRTDGEKLFAYVHMMTEAVLEMVKTLANDRSTEVDYS